jgi:hypothetical protein
VIQLVSWSANFWMGKVFEVNTNYKSNVNVISFLSGRGPTEFNVLFE